MNWYKNHPEEWKEIIETVAREIGRTELMVEKDTVQSMFLSELSKAELPFVFKGGTSLSKAYNMIDRFSEDIELIIQIAESLGMTLANPDKIRSRYEYNKYVFKYMSLFVSMPVEIIIETSYYQTSYPVEKHEVGSFIGHFCEERGVDLPIPFKAAKVYMNVQSIRRTFVDKVFAICDYRIQNMQDRDSRHLYDICKLAGQLKLDEEMDALVDKVREDRMLSPNNPSAQPNYIIPEMLEEIIESKFYESDYKNVTQKLLYEDIDYDYAVQNGIALVAQSDVFIYKKGHIK